MSKFSASGWSPPMPPVGKNPAFSELWTIFTQGYSIHLLLPFCQESFFCWQYVSLGGCCLCTISVFSVSFLLFPKFSLICFIFIFHYFVWICFRYVFNCFKCLIFFFFFFLEFYFSKTFCISFAFFWKILGFLFVIQGARIDLLCDMLKMFGKSWCFIDIF